MKKNLFVLFALIAFSLPSFAVITPEEATSQKYLENHNGSKELARLVELQKAQINGTKTNYVSSDPDWYHDKKVNFIRKVFMYFDCGLDNGEFMQNSSNYTVRFNDL